jgi:hypothetical protein
MFDAAPPGNIGMRSRGMDFAACSRTWRDNATTAS